MELNSIKKGRYDRQKVITGMRKSGDVGVSFYLVKLNKATLHTGTHYLFNICALPMYSAEHAIRCELRSSVQKKKKGNRI